MERVKLIRFVRDGTAAARRRRQQQQQSSMTSEVESQQHFIDSCIDQLTPKNNDDGDQNDDDVEVVSQVDFASFVILYCRHEKNEPIRGPICTNTLFFFDDLPIDLQLEFVRYSTCYLSSDTTKDVELEQCLEENDLLTMDSIDQIPDLCSSTYPLMISTNLLLQPSDSPVISPTVMPIIQKSNVPTMGPVSSTTNIPSHQPMMTSDTIDRSRISTVGILGIVVTALFSIMFCYQCIAIRRNRFKFRLSKKHIQNDAIELQEDGSVVASEHSHELQSASAGPMSGGIVEDEADQNRPILDKTWDALGRSWRSPKQSRNDSLQMKKSTKTQALRLGSKSPQRHPNRYGEVKKMSQPPQLITENLSEDNPVHTRKRFQQKKGSGHFPFDDEASNRYSAKTQAMDHPNNKNLMISMEDGINNTKLSNMSSNLQINTNLKSATNIHVPVIQQQVNSRSSITNPIPQLGGKENNNNIALQSHATVQKPKKSIMGRSSMDGINTGEQRGTGNQQQIQAITFGNVIHTSAIQRSNNATSVATTRRSNPLLPKE